jgi:hypothetical protein
VILQIDELLELSLSNMVISVDSSSLKRPFSKSTRLLTSEYYPNKIFVWTKGLGKFESNLSIYYLEVEEFPRIIHMRDHVLPEPSSSTFGIGAVSDMDFSDDRLVVHLKSHHNLNWIAVYDFGDHEAMTLLKIYPLPSLLQDPGLRSLIRFYRHFQSSLYVNFIKPYHVLKVHTWTGQLSRTPS